MAVDFVLPALGENVDTGDVVEVLVSVGDTIAVDQPVVEVETGKAVVDVPSSVGGKVTAIHVKPGDTIQVGEKVLTVEGDAAAEQPSEPEQVAGEEAVRAVEARVEADTEADIAEEVVPETQTPPQAAPAEAAPEPTEQPAPADQRAEAAVAGTRPTAAGEAGPSGDEAQRQPVMAAPSVRQFAREIGIDIRAVSGSGPGGRISIEDVKRHAREQGLGAKTPAAAAPAAPAVAELPDFSAFGAVERQTMSAVRRATAQQLSTSWTTIPHVNQFDTADATDLEALRKQYQAVAERAGGKLTVTAILVKIAAAALRRFPQFNASVDMARQEIVYKQYCHIGVAVDTDRGLVVPVIRDADRKNIVELAIELGEMAERARERKIKLDEMQGGSFTISNLGGLGGKHFAPIINHPEVAILGVGRASQQPAYVDGQIVPRLLMPLALSYDHRLIDGADGTRFLRWIVEAVEQPFLISLEG